MSLVLASEGEGFTSPGPIDFEFPPIPGLEFAWLGAEGITKPMALLVLGGILTFGLLYWAAAKGQMVPGRVQYVGEVSYSFVRNTLGRDVIGSEHFLRYVPFLVTLFFFILINNLFAAVPLIQFPTMARAGFPYALAGLVWFVYMGVGIRQHGFLKFLRLQTMPPGVPKLMYVLLIPLEFLSNILVRPITLGLRLFANMFAGHLLVVLFAVGGEYLLLEASAALKPVGILAWVMFILIGFLELLVQFLQAFIFTILTALYISSSLEEEH
ncbi:F0F1 ATP synthase subunit A [Nocardioidaceae bacterium]|nr:F0F1 ATP synthase subunit A [Nocardioidaceae bacterium]